MKKYLIGLVAFVVMLFPVMVNAQTITEASEPVYYEAKELNEKQTSPFFVANGTPIVIEDRGGDTYITWEGGEQAVASNTVVLGGYYNPYNKDDSVTSIDIDSTSIKMTGGEVAYIVGGNGVDANYSQYDVIHVGTINVNMTGGTVKEISGTSAALSGIINTALGSSYYEKIESFYYADKVNITIDNAVVTGRVYVTSSYTYAEEATINVLNGADIRSANIQLEGKPVLPVSLSAGTNGKVGTFVANIEDSSVDQIDLGLRVIVDQFTANISGDSEIGDIYAGAELPVAAKSNNTALWNNIGTVPYGQAAKIDFNIGEGVTYNNIYAGFQFATLDGTSEYDTFYTNFASNAAINSTAAGLGESVKSAPVTINTAVAPSVTDSDLESMFDAKYFNVTVTYNATTTVPTIPSGEVDEPTFGIIDPEGTDTILGASITNNEKVTAALNEGKNVATAVEVKTTVNPTNEEVSLIDQALAKLNGETIIAGYYDIRVLVKANDDVIDTLTTLVKPISLTIVLPSDLQNVAEGYTRTYYVARIHDGEVQLLDTVLAEDGKSLTFETDKFSTYALTYVDTLTSEEEIKDPTTPGEEVTTPEEPSNPSEDVTTPEEPSNPSEDVTVPEEPSNPNEEETPEVPQTFDNLTTYVVVGLISVLAIVGAVVYIKKKQTN